VFQAPNFKPNEIRDRLSAPNFSVDSDILQGRKISFDQDTGDRKSPSRVMLKVTRRGDQFVFDSLN